MKSPRVVVYMLSRTVYFYHPIKCKLYYTWKKQHCQGYIRKKTVFFSIFPIVKLGYTVTSEKTASLKPLSLWFKKRYCLDRWQILDELMDGAECRIFFNRKKVRKKDLLQHRASVYINNTIMSSHANRDSVIRRVWGKRFEIFSRISKKADSWFKLHSLFSGNTPHKSSCDTPFLGEYGFFADFFEKMLFEDLQFWQIRVF